MGCGPSSSRKYADECPGCPEPGCAYVPTSAVDTLLHRDAAHNSYSLNGAPSSPPSAMAHRRTLLGESQRSPARGVMRAAGGGGGRGRRRPPPVAMAWGAAAGEDMGPPPKPLSRKEKTVVVTADANVRRHKAGAKVRALSPRWRAKFDSSDTAGALSKQRVLLALSLRRHKIPEPAKGSPLEMPAPLLSEATFKQNKKQAKLDRKLSF